MDLEQPSTERCLIGRTFPQTWAWGPFLGVVLCHLMKDPSFAKGGGRANSCPPTSELAEIYEFHVWTFPLTFMSLIGLHMGRISKHLFNARIYENEWRSVTKSEVKLNFTVMTLGAMVII